MNYNNYLKLLLILPIACGMISCFREKKPSNLYFQSPGTAMDTVIVKKELTLNLKQSDYLSKAYSYCWLAGKDTLDFRVDAREYAGDNTLLLSVSHKNPILFAEVLIKMNNCFPIIKEDFNLSNLSSLYFREPIYYVDLATDLSIEYEKQFGQKNINYVKLNTFLLNSRLNEHIEKLVEPLDKRVTRYSIEKFHLLEKKYFKHYVPNSDLSKYPEVSLHGIGLSLRLENKNN